MMIRVLISASMLAAPTGTAAGVLEIQPVTDNVWAIVGPTEQRSPENLANNATFGLVVTPEGAVLMDPGGSYKGAEMLHDAVRSITDQPVEYIITTGGQDHRWLGNGYWQAQGATVIASMASACEVTRSYAAGARPGEDPAGRHYRLAAGRPDVRLVML